jgi:hypothetical protein
VQERDWAAAPAPVTATVKRAAPWEPVLVAATGLVGTAWVAAVDPNSPGHYPGCPFLMFTGYYCPGCGSLRAVHALSRGDLVTALHDNALTTIGVPFAVWAWVAWFLRVRSGRSARWTAPPWALWTGLGVLLLFWVVRNLPGFGWLGP